VRLSRLLLLVAACGAVTTTSCRRPSTQEWQPPPASAHADSAGLRSDRFGIVGRTVGRTATTHLDDLGVGWVRIPVTWGQVEPRRGDYKWAAVSDAVRAEARTRPGMRAMVTLEAKSPWAGRGTGGEVGEKATVPPRDLDAYSRFVHGMVTRGRGVVECWQIENEMESQFWWAGTSQDYLALLRTAHRAIRSADPSAKVAVGGFTSWTSSAAVLVDAGKSKAEIARELGYGEIGGRDTSQVEASVRRSLSFVDDVLGQGAEYFDIVDLHLYHRYETIPMRVEWLRAKMRANGYEKPIWATEVGGPDTAVLPHSDSVQAQEVVKRVVLALSSGVEKVFWLGLSEMHDQGERFKRMGLTTTSWQRKPAFEAYRLTIRKLDELRYSSSVEVAGGYGLRFGQGAQGVWVLWADRGAKLRLQTGARHVLVTHLDGREERLTTDGGEVELSLTARPIFVEGVAG